MFLSGTRGRGRIAPYLVRRQRSCLSRAGQHPQQLTLSCTCTVCSARFFLFFRLPVPAVYGDDEFGDDVDDRHASSNFPHLPRDLPHPTHPACTALRHAPRVPKPRTLFRARKRKGVDWRRPSSCETKNAPARKIPSRCFFTLIEPIMQCRRPSGLITAIGLLLGWDVIASKAKTQSSPVIYLILSPPRDAHTDS